jgi:hypothetical protein
MEDCVLVRMMCAGFEESAPGTGLHDGSPLQMLSRGQAGPPDVRGKTAVSRGFLQETLTGNREWRNDMDKYR